MLSKEVKGRVLLSFLLAVFLFTIPLFTTPLVAGEAEASVSMSLEIEKYQLENGLTVILHEDHRTPFVAVNVTYDVGAMNDVLGKSGFAHLFEHLMFQGTPYTGEDQFFKYLSSVGAKEVNGTTSQYRTNYYETVPQHELELALWLESDRMGFLKSGVTQAKLDEQRLVVKNERRQRYENAPYRLAGLRHWEIVFPLGRPMHYSGIGSMQDLESASLADVHTFYEKFYAPSNATLVLVGDFDRAEVKPLIEKYFAPLRKVAKAIKAIPKRPKIARKLELKTDEPLGKQERLEIIFVGPAMWTAAAIDLELFQDLFSNGKDSVLYQELVQNEAMALNVGSYMQANPHFSTIHFIITLQNGQNAAVVKQKFENLLAENLERMFAEDDFQAIRATMSSALVMSMESLSTKAALMQIFEKSWGEANALDRVMQLYNKSSPQSVQKTARKYLDVKHSAAMHAVPVKDAPSTKKGAQ